jgi:sugar/nucleoside kinase (ribokinase family)
VTDRIVVVGDLMVDVVARLSGPLARGSDTAARIERHGGGQGANVAAWLAACGVPVTFVGRAGDDALGREAVAELEAGGVDTRVTLDPDRPTGTCLVLVEPGGERTMVPDPGANDALVVEDLPDGTHLHLAGYTLLREGSRAAGIKALTLARARGMTASLDPSSAAPLATVGVARFLEWAGPVDLLVPNADEATLLGAAPAAVPPPGPSRIAAGSPIPIPAGGPIPIPAREIVVTLGPDGALWTDGSRTLSRPAEPVGVVDTTGAGDAFAAGLLSVWRPGGDPEAALAAGCGLAARAVSKPGARPR